ncbi:hypothetical protein G7Y89_g13360 [Cudoniella acicularis]|uniref:RING-type domain-containing protein n=1 Tax=Cudoniella acicularis TaxID=354080 RepID=A0A8H4R9I0_9HELO|nr:hypothetical protein G7Y89_g13360 [Cudoniella acicularis]
MSDLMLSAQSSRTNRQLITLPNEAHPASLQFSNLAPLSVGFLYLVNTGLELLIREVHGKMEGVFQLPVGEKKQCNMRNSPSFLGYTNLGAETTASVTDIREQFDFGTLAEKSWTESDLLWRRLEGPSQYPNSDVKELVERYTAQISILSSEFLHHVAECLTPPPDSFDSFVGNMSRMKLVKYPLAAPGLQGVGPHKNSIGLFTFLSQDNVGGLQVLNRSGKWIDAPPIEGSLVVNIAQGFEAITSESWIAARSRKLAASCGCADDDSIEDGYPARVNVQQSRHSNDAMFCCLWIILISIVFGRISTGPGPLPFDCLPFAAIRKNPLSRTRGVFCNQMLFIPDNRVHTLLHLHPSVSHDLRGRLHSPTTLSTIAKSITNHVFVTTTPHQIRATTTLQNGRIMAMESDEVPRGSTETQRRNGFAQSHAKDRGVRITEDITNGNYMCSICTEAIVAGNSREYSMWHCTDCFNVFHFRCVKAWADASGTLGITGQKTWKCPFCQVYQDKLPKATCWCGKESFDLSNAAAPKPNACLNKCERKGSCAHGNSTICSKNCHPGPCKWKCTATCDNLPPRPVKPPGAIARFRKRFKDRPKGKITGVIVLFTLLAASNVAMYFFFAAHVRWWAHPYEYPNFSTSSVSDWETGLLIVFGGLIIWPLLCVLIFGFCNETSEVVSQLLDLKTPTTKKNRKACTLFLLNSFLFIVGLTLAVLPWVGFCGGPDIAWYNQMKDSCNGLNTRIWMDSAINPRYTFTFQSLTPNIKDSNFFLASHLEPVPDSNQPFQYYQRLSGGTPNTPNVAVDIDMQNNLWRIMSLNDTDIANNWTANAAKINTDIPGTSILEFPVLPTFKPINETLLRNGTFTPVSWTNIHMNIPELNLAIANMNGWYQMCDLEPFMRVFNTSGLAQESSEMSALLDAKWNGTPNDKVVMRTASFGHGRGGISMCIKEGDIMDLAAEETPVNQGVQDEMLVPFALLAAVRMRVNETDFRTLDSYTTA